MSSFEFWLTAMLVGYLGLVLVALVVLNVRANSSAKANDPEREILDDDTYDQAYEE